MLRCLLILFFVAGCTLPDQRTLPTSEPPLFSRAQAAILREDWDDAAVCLARFIREQPTHPYACQARYLLGIYYLRVSDLEGARDQFTYVADHTNSGRLKRHAKIRLGDTALAEGQLDEAASTYRELLRDARRYGDEAELCFKLGVVRQRQGRWEEAESLFDQVRKRYPGMVFAKRAMEQLALPHYFSLQVGAFREKKNAERKFSSLRNKGYQADLIKVNRHGRPFWCVWVGAFKSREEALQFKENKRSDPDLASSEVIP